MNRFSHYIEPGPLPHQRGLAWIRVRRWIRSQFRALVGRQVRQLRIPSDKTAPAAGLAYGTETHLYRSLEGRVRQ